MRSTTTRPLIVLAALVMAIALFAMSDSVAVASPGDPLLISPTSFDFGDVAVGSTSPEQRVTITNVSDEPMVLRGAGGGAGLFGGVQNCEGRTLNPGQSCQMWYAFSPDKLGPITGSTSGNYNGVPFSFTFKGTGVQPLLISPTSFDFGDVAVGSTSPEQRVTVTNVSTSPMVLHGAGGGAGLFGGVQNCEGRTLNPGDSCQVWYAFSPDRLGPITGSTSGNYNGVPFSFTFKGNGVQPLLISPTSFDFGDVAVGTTSPEQYVTVTNVSTSPMVMKGAGGGAGVFGGVQNCEGRTLNPGESCKVWYAFSPTAVGPVTGGTSGNYNGVPFALTFTGNAVPEGTPPSQPLLISPRSFDFGNVAVGSTSPDQRVTVTNVSDSPIVLRGAGGGAGIFGGVQNCEGRTLNPGDSCQVWYAFSPDKLGPITGSTSGNYNGVPFSFSFKGNGVQPLLISPTSFDFGNVAVGSKAPDQYVTVTNVSTSPMVMKGAGGGAGIFGGVQNCESRTLNPGESCKVWYAFSPNALGPATGGTSGNYNGVSFSFSFKGNGLSPLLISPTSFDFGDVAVGERSPDQYVTVTNVGTSPMVMKGAGGGAGVFGGVQNCESRTLNPGQSCQVWYAFSPTTPGPVNGGTSGNYNGVPFAFSFKGNGTTLSCPPGSYSETGAQPCNPAPAGSFVSGWGATSATLCAPGSFSSAPGAVACETAPAGSFVSGSGATSATLCAPGSFSSAPGAVACDLAPAGSFVSGSGATSATLCAAGSFSSASGAVTCDLAPAGSFVSGSGATSATLCAPGRFSSAPGAVACDAAPAGSFVSGSGATSATLCAPGSFSSAPGATACDLAPAGSFVAASGATSATLCAPGAYSAITGATACTLADVGFYAAGEGNIEQTACPAGTYSPLPGAAECTAAEQLVENLAVAVQEAVADTTVESSLLSKLTNAGKSLEAGNSTAACNQIRAFINQVSAQSGKKLSTAEADALIADARNVLVAEGCTAGL